MNLSSELLKVLTCPVTKSGNLIYDRVKQEIISVEAGLAYPIIDGIPMMLRDSARILTSEETKKLA
jgi:uncharacterized protein YbaR (Trm112 family)